MKDLILKNAKSDIPKYLDEFNLFWNETFKYIIDEDLTKCYANTLIFKNWRIGINYIGVSEFDSILLEIIEDINSSFYLAAMGQYRSAHMHLRSAIELSLQFLYFFQHEVEFSQWLDGDFRIKHEELALYLKKHPKLLDKKCFFLIEEVTKKWKLFSKFIHGESLNYFQTTQQSSQTNAISQRDLGIWKSNFLDAGYLLNKLFLFFFIDRFNSFPSQNRDILLLNMKDKDLVDLGFGVS